MSHFQPPALSRFLDTDPNIQTARLIQAQNQTWDQTRDRTRAHAQFRILNWDHVQSRILARDCAQFQFQFLVHVHFLALDPALDPILSPTLLVLALVLALPRPLLPPYCGSLCPTNHKTC